MAIATRKAHGMSRVTQCVITTIRDDGNKAELNHHVREKRFRGKTIKKH
jgi:hypothetical protein